MDPSDNKLVKLLVVDSSAFIKAAPLKDLTNHVYTIDGVIGEIKDTTTRKSLEVVPYELKIKQPIDDAVAFINTFSKKTGDYSNLSIVDMHLLALTYQLCKENYDQENFSKLKKEPSKNQQVLTDVGKISLDSKAVNIAGFYMPTASSSSTSTECDTNNNDLANVTKKMDENINLLENNERKEVDVDENVDDDDEGNYSEEDEDDDDGEGAWITPANIEEAKKKSIIDSEKQEITSQILVGCMTSDFAMQNVLIQIGIPVLSVDGLLIKKAREYVKKCITCKKITTNMLKEFCPNCGYKTLERTLVTVDSDGNRVYRGRRKPISAKSLRFSLPTPRGGKHSNYPILSEDQPRPQNLPSKKALIKYNALDPDYICNTSPFANRDVYSRAANLGIRAKNSGNDRFNKRK